MGQPVCITQSALVRKPLKAALSSSMLLARKRQYHTFSVQDLLKAFFKTQAQSQASAANPARTQRTATKVP